MKGSITAAAIVAFGLVATALNGAQAGGVRIVTGSGLSVTKQVTSWKEAKFKNVVPQQYDYSCGSAAIATLLTYHYDRPTDERQAFKQMFRSGDREAIREHGFSLLDMKAYLKSRGLNADGFRMSLSQLRDIGVPAITLVTTKGYRHFVVVKGVREDDVLVGDPALGLRTLTHARFKEIWNGVTFVVRDDVKLARKHFNRVTEWRLRPKTPYQSTVDRYGLSTFSLLHPGRNEF
ncbi:C39 family peptidase [Limimonas halophila]|nr:C39 family peptidase [Limimonas halophila]